MNTVNKLKRVFILFLFVGALLLAVNMSKGVAQSTPGFTQIQWSNAAPSPAGKAEAAGAIIGKKLYMFGGFYISPRGSWTPTRGSYVYDLGVDKWQRLADTPKPITHAGIATDGANNIYLAGGYINNPTGPQLFATTEVRRYNTDSNTWHLMPSLPQPRGGGALTNLNGVLHFFGGADPKRLDKGEHWYLNLNGGTEWVASTPLPIPRSHLGGVVLGNKIYAVGGQTSYDQYLTTQNSVHVWDPNNPGVWSSAANLPKARSHNGMGTFAMNGRIIVIGGETAHNVPISDVTAYDPIANSYQVLTPLPARLHSGVGGTIDGKIYYNGGAPAYTTGSGKRTFRTTTNKGTPLLVR